MTEIDGRSIYCPKTNTDVPFKVCVMDPDLRSHKFTTSRLLPTTELSIKWLPSIRLEFAKINYFVTRQGYRFYISLNTVR